MEFKTIKECKWQLEQDSITVEEKVYWKQQEYKTLQEIEKLQETANRFLSLDGSHLTEKTYKEAFLKTNHKIQDLLG